VGQEAAAAAAPEAGGYRAGDRTATAGRLAETDRAELEEELREFPGGHARPRVAGRADPFRPASNGPAEPLLQKPEPVRWANIV
jgi:hypothetical protein